MPLERPTGQDKPRVEGSELEALLERREQQRASTARTIGGITGAGPTHWYENWGRVSARTSLVVDPPDGHVPPLTPEAQKRQRARTGGAGSFGNGPFDRPEDFTLYDRCITRGLPSVMFPAIYNNNTRIVQAPGYVALTYEMIHETRVIPLDGRPFTSERIRGYMGDARARWEGDTLVVETQNFSERANYRGAGATLRLVERFRRVRAPAAALRSDGDRPAHLHAAVDGGRQPRPGRAPLRVRVPRRQLRHAQHAQRGAGS